MISLFITGTASDYSSLKETFAAKDWNVITYTSFHKAFDNLDEINPDVIVISSKDYPRHWKILTEVMKPSKGRYAIILLTDILMNPEDLMKAGLNNVLQIKMSDSAVFPVDFDKVTDFVKNVAESVSVIPGDYKGDLPSAAAEESSEDEYIPTVDDLLSESGKNYITEGNSSCSFAFLNPAVMSIITGKVISFIYPEITFMPDRTEGFKSLYIGQILEDCTLKTEIGLSSVKTCITDVSDKIIMHIC